MASGNECLLFGIFTPYDIFLNDMYKYHAWIVYLMTSETLVYSFRAFCFIATISFFFFYYSGFSMSSTSSFTGLDGQMSLRARDTGSTEGNKKGQERIYQDLQALSGGGVYRFLEEIQEQSKARAATVCTGIYVIKRRNGREDVHCPITVC